MLTGTEKNMGKKPMEALFAAAIAFALTACSIAANHGGLDQAAPGQTKESGIRLVNGRIEADAALKAAAQAYEDETGIPVEIESMGGGVEIQDVLKGYYKEGRMPDIFVCNKEEAFENWDGLLADLGDQEWVSDTETCYADESGRIIGFPVTTEAIGLACNADLLEKAGIDEDSITGPDSMRAAFGKLDAMKEELGLTAVVGWCPEAEDLHGYSWFHSMANYLDAGLARSDTTYPDLFEQGRIDEERFRNYAEMVGLFNEYTDPDLIDGGTCDQQILGFSSGRYAFITQGSWISEVMTQDYADEYADAGNFEVDLIPYAFEEGIDTVLTASPFWWAVLENENTQRSKDFLTWLSGSEGQKFLVEDGGFISPFRSCACIAEDPFAQSIADYTDTGRTSAWHWLKEKAFMKENVLGQLYLDYALGSITDAEQFTEEAAELIGQYFEPMQSVPLP